MVRVDGVDSAEQDENHEQEEPFLSYGKERGNGVSPDQIAVVPPMDPGTPAVEAVGNGTLVHPPNRSRSSSINPKLLPVKLLVFLVHGGIAALFPFFGLHMGSLGISTKEMSWMLLLLPIVSSIGPPLGGALADRLGNYKLVLIIFTILSVILHLLLWFAVPAYGPVTISQETNTTRSDFRLTFPCSADQQLPAILNMQAPPGKVYRNCNLTDSWTSAKAYNCNSSCSSGEICFITSEGGDSCYHWMDIESLRVEDVSVRNLSSSNGSTDSLRSTTRRPGGGAPGGHHGKPGSPGPPAIRAPPASFRANFFSFPTLSEFNLKRGHCVIPNTTNCSVTCSVKSENQFTCLEDITEQKGDRMKTLALYFTFRFLSFTAARVVFPLLDAALLEITKEHGGDFGVQRLFASVGFAVMPPLSGLFFGIASKRSKSADYSPAFYIFAAMNVLAAILMLVMKISVRKRATNICCNIGRAVLCKPTVPAFAFAIMISGAAFGFLVHFLFLFMKTDSEFTSESPGYLLGLTSTVGYLLGIPLLYYSSQLIRKIGLENLLALGILCYAIRLVSYSFTYDPFSILPIEILTAVTGMVLVLMPQFALRTAPKELATLVGLFGAINFGIGGGIGPWVGGLLIDSYGYRTAFQIFSGMCAAAAVLYFVVHHLIQFIQRSLKRKQGLQAAARTIDERDLGKQRGEESKPLRNGDRNEAPKENTIYWDSGEGALMSDHKP